MEIQKEKIIYHYIYDPKKYSGRMFDQFLAMGWYRMKQKIFTTTHNQYGNGPENINRVWWLRYNVNELSAHDSHKRLKRKSARFEITIEKFHDNSLEEHDLYDIYMTDLLKIVCSYYYRAYSELRTNFSSNSGAKYYEIYNKYH